MQCLISQTPSIPPSEEESTFIRKLLPCENINATLRAMASYRVESVESIMDFQECTRESAEDYVVEVVWCDVSLVNTYWSHDTRFFLPPFASSDDGWQAGWKKYMNSKRDILDGPVREPPKLSFPEDENELSFINGRHRFACLRDSNVTAIPCIVFRSELENFRKAGILVPNP